MLKKLLLLLIITGLGFAASAQQTKEEIQRKQQELQKELSDLNRTLSEIKKNRKQSIGQLELVQRKINAREELVRNLNRDMRLIDDNIYLTNVEITRLKRELDTLKDDYAKSLVFAYKNRSNYDYLNFLFSATNFNDAVKRMAYLKSYRQYRETQVGNIEKTQKLLQDKANVLNANKQEKNNNIQQQNQQLKVLQDDRKEKDLVVKQLKGQEQGLSKEIKERERARQKLSASLQAIIRREIDEERKREAARIAEEKRKADALAKANPTNNANAPSTTTTPRVENKRSERSISALESTPEGLTLSLNFEKNKGRLPWPVAKGDVVIPFGKYEVPGTRLKGVSDGIEIAVDNGATVKAVADGEVRSVVDMGGGDNAVIVRHGKYFTTYSNLSSVSVSKGQEVKAGTVLGKAGVNTSGEGQFLFMVTNENGSPLNPESWLSRR